MGDGAGDGDGDGVTSPSPVETLARSSTPRGEVVLREREEDGRVVHELVVAGVFAMDSRDTSTETALAEEALRLVADPARVLVGGLGLGFTALTVLKDGRVRALDVLDVEADLLAWARLGLTPTLTLLARHPRVALHHGDVLDLLAGADDEAPGDPGEPVDAGAAGAGTGQRAADPALPSGPWDLVLLDVDNGPSFLLHPGNARLYRPGALRAALTHVAPGGALAIWAAQREPTLLADLSALAPTQEHAVTVHREGRDLEYAIYLSRP